MPTPSKKRLAADAENRPFTLALSQAEIAALVRFHVGQAKRVTKALGLASLKLRANSPLWSGREMKGLHDEAKKHLDNHMTRAKGLASLIHP